MESDTIKAFRQDPRDPSTPGCPLPSQKPVLPEPPVENDGATADHDDASDPHATAGTSIAFDEEYDVRTMLLLLD